MEPREKRHKVAITDDFVFVYQDGHLIDPKLIFAQDILGGYGDAVEKLILSHPSAHSVLGALSENQLASGYIIRRQLWMKLFKRNYFPQFCYAYDAQNRAPICMRQHVMDVLDNLSSQPNRPETYWKRFYELQRSKIPKEALEDAMISLRGDATYLALSRDTGATAFKIYKPTILANAHVVLYVVFAETFDMLAVVETAHGALMTQRVPYDLALISDRPVQRKHNGRTWTWFLDRTGIVCVYVAHSLAIVAR